MQYQDLQENPMFNMQMTGARISQLRRQANLTQAELAEKLGVSYQAVSAWERGASMPDIGKLVDLSRTLGATVDYLLSGENAPQQTPAPADPVPAPAPAAEEAPEVHQHITVSAENPDFATLMALAPFADQKTLDQMALEMEGTDAANLIALAPFLSSETLESLVERSDISGNLSMLTGLAPFLSSDTVNRLIQRSRVQAAAPAPTPAPKAVFSGSAIADLIRRCDMDEIPDLARRVRDSLDDESIAQLIQACDMDNIPALAQALEGKLNADHITRLIQACDSDEILDLAQTLGGQLTDDHISLLFQQCDSDELLPLVDLLADRLSTAQASRIIQLMRKR